MPRFIQNTLTPLYEMKKLKGIDNVATDDLRLDPGFVRVAENVDFDSELMTRRRQGILRQIASGAAHSGWSDEDKLSYLVLNNNLVQLNLDWTTTTILVNVGSSKMHFVPIAKRIFFSNVSRAGYILDGTAYDFPDTTRPNRVKMVGAGELIEYSPPRLYVVQGDFLIRSVAYDPLEMDPGRDIQYLNGPVTMLTGVNGPGGESGLYLSADNKCFYVSNLEPDFGQATYKPILDLPALRGSAKKLERIDLNGQKGECAIWATTEGFYMGFPGGYVKDLTTKHYTVKNIEEGFSLVRSYMGYRQYIFMGQAAVGVGGNSMGAVEGYDTALITFQ